MVDYYFGDTSLRPLTLSSSSYNFKRTPSLSPEPVYYTSNMVNVFDPVSQQTRYQSQGANHTSMNEVESVQNTQEQYCDYINLSFDDNISFEETAADTSQLIAKPKSDVARNVTDGNCVASDKSSEDHLLAQPLTPTSKINFCNNYQDSQSLLEEILNEFRPVSQQASNQLLSTDHSLRNEVLSTQNTQQQHANDNNPYFHEKDTDTLQFKAKNVARKVTDRVLVSQPTSHKYRAPDHSFKNKVLTTQNTQKEYGNYVNQPSEEKAAGSLRLVAKIVARKPTNDTSLASSHNSLRSVNHPLGKPSIIKSKLKGIRQSFRQQGTKGSKKDCDLILDLDDPNRILLVENPPQYRLPSSESIGETEYIPSPSLVPYEFVTFECQNIENMTKPLTEVHNSPCVFQQEKSLPSPPKFPFDIASFECQNPKTATEYDNDCCKPKFTSPSKVSFDIASFESQNQKSSKNRTIAPKPSSITRISKAAELRSITMLSIENRLTEVQGRTNVRGTGLKNKISGRVKLNRLCDYALEILNGYFESSTRNPTRENKKELAVKCGVTYEQVSRWFICKRRQYKRKEMKC